jgi:cytochrome P450
MPGPPDDARQAVSGSGGPEDNRGPFPLGAAVTMRDLDGELHPVLRRLRAREPVSWLPVLGGWLVTRRDLALRVLRDSQTFTVDDPRFSTARVVGPSMLSLDGAEHKRHRDPFAEALRLTDVQARLEEFVEAEAGRLVSGFADAGQAELRRGLAGPLAVAVVAEVLGLGDTDPRVILSWYDEIVGAVSALAGQSGQGGGQGSGTVAPGAGSGQERIARGSEAFGRLKQSVEAVMARADGNDGSVGGDRGSLLAAVAGRGGQDGGGRGADGRDGGGRDGGGRSAGGLAGDEVVSNAAVLAFGGIETTEGMICNAVLQLLSDPGQLAEVIADHGLAANAVEESLRLEPAATVVDRYATADVSLGTAHIRRGDFVTVSLAGAGRDPAFFPDPDRFDVHRANARQHLAFAHGPHFCLGAHLARLEARAAMLALLRLPGLRLDGSRPAAARGIVFRKPPELHVRWDVTR